jgi:hypothetical protein
MFFLHKLRIIALIILSGCTIKKNVDTHLIYGTWILQNNNTTCCSTINFDKDSTAIFYSIGDTLYRFTYIINGHNLILT